MAIRVVRLGDARVPHEGLRIGTVRRPPRGVPKAQHAARNYYDVWLPHLAPAAETVKLGLDAVTDRDWRVFVRRYRTEMAAPVCVQTMDLLAALSHRTDFSIGCYCPDEQRCHRSVLRDLLAGRGARLA